MSAKHSAAWRAKYPERHRLQQVNARARAHGVVGTLTLAEFHAIVARQGGRCAICNEVKPLTIDHIIPIFEGGANYAYNVQALCIICNCRKGPRIPQDAQYSLFDRVRPNE